jgi:hypothetical protein
MTRQILILFIIPIVLTGFQDIKPEDNIIGTYSRESECCGYYSDKFIIKKDFQYTRTYSLNNFDQVGSWTTSGTWSLKHDTLILIPKTVKLRKGNKCNCANQSGSLGQMAQLCNTDTLTFKENTLWTLNRTEYISIKK